VAPPLNALDVVATVLTIAVIWIALALLDRDPHDR
jgi:hypothetical protein